MSKKKKAKSNPPTIITLTLPTLNRDELLPEAVLATLLIQRGDLAQMKRFDYNGTLDEITSAIRDAQEAIGLIEADPPEVPDLPASKPKSKAKQKQTKVDDSEPTIDIPLKSGKTQAIKMSYLKIVEGDSDAAAYRQAVVLAGRLIDGKLWDGETPIRFKHVNEVAGKMKHLSDKEFALFSLEDFVQTGTDETAAASPDAVDEPSTSETDEQNDDALNDAHLPYFTMFKEELPSSSADDEGHIAKLTQLTKTIYPIVEKATSTVGFWENALLQQNGLKADLQTVFLSSMFKKLPPIRDKRHQLIERIFEIARPDMAKETSYPAEIDTDAKQAIYAVLDDAELTLDVYEAIQKNKKHGWRGDLFKERQIKGFIAQHVDGKESLVEAIFEIVKTSPEFDNADASNSHPQKTVVEVLTSPDLAALEQKDDPIVPTPAPSTPLPPENRPQLTLF